MDAPKHEWNFLEDFFRKILLVVLVAVARWLWKKTWPILLRHWKGLPASATWRWVTTDFRTTLATAASRGKAWLSQNVVARLRRWIERTGRALHNTDVPQFFARYNMSPSLLPYIAARNGELLAQFPNPTAALAFYDFSFERIPKEKQVELARKLLEEYRVILGTLASSESPGMGLDRDTVRKLRFVLGRRLAHLASEGIWQAEEAVNSILADAEERELGQVVSLYCQAV